MMRKERRSLVLPLSASVRRKAAVTVAMLAAWSFVVQPAVYGHPEVGALPAAVPVPPAVVTPDVQPVVSPAAPTPVSPAIPPAASHVVPSAVSPAVSPAEMEETRARLRETEGKRRNALDELHEIQDTLVQTSGQIERTKIQLTLTQAVLVKTQAQLAQAQIRLGQDRNRLAKRIVAARRNGEGGYLGVALGARDFQDFLQREEFVSRVLRSDVTLIQSVRHLIDEVETKKAEIERQRALQGNLLASLNAQRETQSHDLLRQKAVYDRLEGERSELESMLARQERDSESVRLMLASPGRSLQGYEAPAVAWTGSFVRPVAGPMTSHFGRRFHPILRVWKLHTGVDFGVPTGTSVQAAADGVVVQSGWMGAYGYAVVLDHGGGVSTLYGHNSSLAVGVGQSVAAGEVISYSGSTGYSTGPHLHFEKRVNGAPVPPF